MSAAAPGVEGRIVASGLTKVFGEIKAVDGLSFSVEPGSVTGFLGPNGAGKTTTLRMILGLAEPTSGTGTISGVAYAHLPAPGRTVGAVLEATSFHPGRSARNHLRVFCAAAGLPDKRADEVLDLVGLAQAARYPVRGFSLGMRQRLGLATALLGNPRVLLLDEPANGLDPEGIVWLRGLLRHFADIDGRTVLVSSHVLSEVEQTVDRVVIIAHGRLIYEGRLADLEGASAGVVVRTPTPDQLSTALAPLNVKVSAGPDGSVAVLGATLQAVGRAAWEAHVELHELRAGSSSLEETFLRLTQDPADPPVASA
ncbi:MAG: ABC transporter ATP-binding protein [Candidatus Dormiibacterota bacterium]